MSDFEQLILLYKQIKSTITVGYNSVSYKMTDKSFCSGTAINRNYAYNSQGYTLIEIVITLGISIIIFLLVSQGLTLLLQARDENTVRQEITQTANLITSLFTQAGQTASRFDGSIDNKELIVTGNPCRLFRFNDLNESLDYAEDESEGCTPPTGVTTTLNPVSVKVEDASFLTLPQLEDAKTVRLTFTLSSSRPFGSDRASFATTISLWKK